VIYNVPRAIKADMETSLHNTSDEPNPVFVAIEPAKSPATTAPASNPTSSVERTVHVRIADQRRAPSCLTPPRLLSRCRERFQRRALVDSRSSPHCAVTRRGRGDRGDQ
jgi:hypothetical protein